MQLEIWYKALVTTDAQIGVSFEPAIGKEIASYNHKEAELFENFGSDETGLALRNGGIRFEYDETKHTVYCVAIYYSEGSLSENQMAEVVNCTTKLLDREYYGEDGWFVDVSPGYYVLLVDPNDTDNQPEKLVAEGVSLNWSNNA